MELYMQMKKQTKVISIQLDLEVYEKLKVLSDENEQPVQGLIRVLIKKYLAQLSEDN